MAKLYDLLGTKDAKDQVRRVEQLMRQAQAPVIDVIIRYDPRTDEVTLQWVGIDKIPVGVLKNLLDQARQIIEEKEIRAKLQQEQANQMPVPIDDGVTAVHPPPAD